MKSALSFLTLTLFVWSIGCSSPRDAGRPAAATKNGIVATLATRDRNAVHVCLWTLRQNGISNYPAIDFGIPYSEARPKIQTVCDYLKTLPDEKIAALDQSLADHWQIYSPIWSSHDWP